MYSWVGPVSFLIAALASKPILNALIAAKSRQTINQHLEEHAHKQGTPTMGGLIILVAIIAAMLLNWQKEIIPMLILVATFGVIGFVDDYVVPRLQEGARGLGWKQKLVLQVVGAGSACYLNGQHDAKTLGLGIFLILFFSNAYNFADGLDGLAGTMGLVLCAGLSLIALFIGIPSPVMIALTGCIAGFLVFLYYNAPPARVFMGDVGALPIGALLGFIVWSLGIYSGPRLVGPLTVVSGMMIIELVPVPIQVAYFKATGKRIFPRTPVHHAFQHAGWPETRVTMMFVLAQCLLVWIGVLWAYGSVQEFVR